MIKEFIMLISIAFATLVLPILAEADVFPIPGELIVQENPVSIFSTTYYGRYDAAILNGYRSLPGDPYAPISYRDNLFLINAWGYQGEEFRNSAAISFEATEDFSPDGTGTCIRFRTTENGTNNRRDRMRIDHNGNVGIGTSDPSSILEVVTEDSLSRIIATSYHTQLSGDHGSGGAFTGRLVRGTSDEPSAVQIDDTIAAFTGQGYNGSGISRGSKGAMFIRAEENWTPGAEGTRIVFVTTPTGSSSPAERLRISSEGNVGIGTDTPQSTLQVNGYVQLALTDGNLPPEADCDESSEYGRMMVDQINEDVYVCVVSGWKTLKGKK